MARYATVLSMVWALGCQTTTAAPDRDAGFDSSGAPLDVVDDDPARGDVSIEVAAQEDAAGPDASPRGDAATVDVPAARDAADVDVAPPRPALRVTGYYAAWMQDAVPPSALALEAVTHVIHFSLVPRADGTLDAAENVLSAAHVRDAVAAVHAAGRKVLVSVGGAGTRDGFVGAWSPARRDAFVSRIVQFVASNGYDGVDIDVEPLLDADADAFRAFARALHRALRARLPDALLTAAVADAPSVYTPVQTLFDQLNVMTYDLSGPWPGWVTWHNAALDNGGARFPSTGAPLPTATARINAFVRSGIDRARLGVGIDFYGYDWTGASGPLQPIAGVTMRPLSYDEVFTRYASRGEMRWDPAARVPYVSVAASRGEPAHFVSFDDARSAVEKVGYARREGLGGVMIWELAGGHRASLPRPERQSLLRAVGAAAR